MLPLSDWQTLLSVQAESAATLTGLVFVAVSINLKTVLATPGLPGRAAESLAQFLQVFFVSTIALIPGQPAGALAIEIIAVALLCWALQFASLMNYAWSKSGHPKWWLIVRIAQTHLASIPFFIAAICLLFGSPAGLLLAGPGVPAFISRRSHECLDPAHRDQSLAFLNHSRASSISPSRSCIR